MKGRITTIVAGLFAAIGTTLLLPQAAFASCQITDPGCYIDDFAHNQLYQLDLSIWQINRAGLVLARWLEDLRVWLTDSVFTDAFTTLTQPVKFAFYLALIVAWLIFIISFMVQSFIDLRWVDLRRATRPILLAVFIFSFGGSLLKGTEQARLLGGTILQRAASEAVQGSEAPRVPTKNTGDMANASSSIYTSGTSCGTPARSQSAMFLNDYSARYLWSNAEDVHCADVMALAGEFYNKYFPYGENIENQPDGHIRQQAVAWAAQGGLRQITGLFMMVGAIIEQIVQLIFAIALALVWFGILISLVFAVFVPTEALFSSQIKALLSVLRASWLASFLIGIGLAVLQIVAESGNAFLLLFCGLVLIAVTIWQGKQALGTMSTALSAVSAASGSAPQAVGGMLRSWGTTAALVAGVAATGGLGAALTSVGSTMVRRAGRSAGDNPLSQAAGRVLSNRVADRLDNYTQDQRMLHDAKLGAAEAAWYERGEYAGAGTPAADDDAKQQAAAAQGRGREQQARLLDRQAERARQKRNFAKAAQLRREASKIRGDTAQRPDFDATMREPDMDPTELDRALEQLQEAQDDGEMQRRVLAETAALAQRRAQLKAMRNLALREKRFGDAKNAIHELTALPADQQPASEPRPASTPASDGLARPASKLRMIRPRPQPTRDLDREIATLIEQIERLEHGAATAPTEEMSSQLGELRARLATAQERRARLQRASQTSLQPTSKASLQPISQASLMSTALTPGGRIVPGQPVAVAQTAAGLFVNGYAVREKRTEADGSRVLDTFAGPVRLAPNDAALLQALPVGQASQVQTRPIEQAATTGTSSATPAQASAATIAPKQPTQVRSESRTAQVLQPGAPVIGSSGAASSLASGQARMPNADAGQHPTVAPAAVAAAPMPDGVATPVPASATVAAAVVPVVSPPVAAASASAPQVVPVVSTPGVAAPPVPAGAPVVAPVPTVPVADGAASPAVVAMPAAAPVSSVAPAAAVAASIDVSAAQPAPGASIPPRTPLIPAAVPPAPRASNGLPLNGAVVPTVATPGAPAAAIAAEERRPVAQPTRATTGSVLPTVAEVRVRPNGADSRPETAPAVPVVPAASTKTTTAPRQPWKRRKQGNE